MGNDPHFGLRRSLLTLVTTNLVQLADAFAAFTRKLRYVTKRAADRADTLFIRTHKRSRLFKIVCAAGLIDPRVDALVRQVVRNLLAQLMARHSYQDILTGID